MLGDMRRIDRRIESFYKAAAEAVASDSHPIASYNS
jgi:hypothetical protein